MTAKDHMRSMLDKLMGTSRDGEDKPRIKFHDPRVCKPYLIGSCPFDLLQNTKMGLGDCAKIHCPDLREEYENYMKSRSRDSYRCDYEALLQLRTFVRDAEARKEINRQNLEQTQQQISLQSEKIQQLEQQIEQNLAHSEKLGQQGKVAESLKIMEIVQNLREQKEKASTNLNGPYPSTTSQLKTFKMCHVCCAHLGVNDRDEKLAGHFGGKLHLGFIKIKETLAKLEDTVGSHHRVQEERKRRSERESDGRRIKRNFKKGYKDIGRRRWHSSRFRTKDSSVSESSSDEN